MTKQSTTDKFQLLVEQFAQELQENFRAGVKAQPEDQLKSPLLQLLKEAGRLSNRKIVARTETHAGQGLGRPDIGVTVDGLLCGYIELKAPGKGGNPEALKSDADREQWKRFRTLPNILYTDSSEWGLYQGGKRAVELVRFDGDVTKKGKRAVQNTGLLQWLLELFFTWSPIIPKDPAELARVLAPLCHYLREDVLSAVQNLDSNIAQLAKEWRDVLFPDADDPKFADAYAQTLTYGLLLARFSGDEPLTMENAPSRLDKAHGVLAQALRILGQVDVQKDIAIPLELLMRVVNAIDRERLQKRGDDPWLYFYEHFLAAYDPKLRKDYGVYYTPIQVIRAQVQLVSELLETRFEKPMNFADDEVVFLDPGAGTGAYPLAALQHGLEAVAGKYGEGMVAGRASKVADNMHAFETLVGPYAVAHMRLTQAILDKDGELPKDGVHVYLSDTLESPNAKLQVTTPVFQKRLAEEHKRAQRVKAETRVLVCMGNPPYDRQQIERGDELTQRKGGWVRFGEREKERRGRPLLEDFLEPARQAGFGVHLKNLYNDYVYFWRWALWKVLEQTEGPGIVSFITASSYLRGPGFVGMREHMRRLFDEIWIIDLEGDNLGARKTENVFAIQTPVAIAVGVRYAKPQRKKRAKAWYAKIAGTRDEKLAQLAEVKGTKSLKWQACFSGWQEPLLPKSRGNYYEWPRLTDLFPWQHSGVQFKRTWPIGETREVLLARWSRLLAEDRDNRDRLMIATGSRHSLKSGTNLVSGERLKTIRAESRSAMPTPPVRYAYRSFNISWVLPDDRLCDRPRPPLWFAHGSIQVYMTSLLTSVLGLGPAAIATHHIPDLDHFRGSFGAKHVIPLFRDREGKQPNLTSCLQETLSKALGRRLKAEDLFAYVYALLATPEYVNQFSEELTIPGPRIPLTKDRKLFDEVAKAGRQLIYLHTYGERFVPKGRKAGEVPQGRARCVKGISERNYPENFSYDIGNRTLIVGDGRFAPVPEEIFEFSVSGFKVVRSWLSYRMKEGAGRKSSELDKIRPEHWTAEMTRELLELMWVLEATIEAYPRLAQLLDQVTASDTFSSNELPKPTDEERRPPRADDEDAEGANQIEADL